MLRRGPIDSETSGARLRGWLALGTCALLCIGFAAGCLPTAEGGSRVAFSAKTLDAIDAAMERLAAGRWPSWSMEIDDGRLAFQVETRANRRAAGTCREIERVVRENAGNPVDWSAEITRGGRVVQRCGAVPAPTRRPRSRIG
jgi:hypothetical protein